MVGLTFFLQSKSYILFSDVNLKSYSGSLSSFVRGFIVPSIIMDPAEPMLAISRYYILLRLLLQILHFHHYRLSMYFPGYVTWEPLSIAFPVA